MVNDSKQRTEAVDGLEYISKLIRRYTEIEHIYLQGDEIILKQDLEATITKLYGQILEYQAKAACQFNRNGAVQFARNLVEADGWKNMLESAKDSGLSCDKLLGIIDAKDQRERSKRLGARVDEQMQKVHDLLQLSHVQDQEYDKLVLAELNTSRMEQNLWHRTSEESLCYECLQQEQEPRSCSRDL